MMEGRPLTGLFERAFQEEAFKIMQKALLASGVRILLHEPKWSRTAEWTESDKKITEALSQIGMLYHELASDSGYDIGINQ
jgi:hypothetical protein